MRTHRDELKARYDTHKEAVRRASHSISGRLAGHVRFSPNSFITVSALSPTLAIAASISAFDFLKCLHQWRANSLVETSTRFRALFREEDVTMTQSSYSVTDKRRISLLFRRFVVSFDAVSRLRSYCIWRYAFRNERTECTQRFATRVLLSVRQNFRY
jgi:hypothetical protein